MGRIATGLAALAYYLFGSGIALAAVSTYWEGLDLGPRDGQAFLGLSLLGTLSAILGMFVGAGVLLARPRGWFALLIAFVVGLLITGAAAVLGSLVAPFAQPLLLALPAAILIALAQRSPGRGTVALAGHGRARRRDLGRIRCRERPAPMDRARDRRHRRGPVARSYGAHAG